MSTQSGFGYRYDAVYCYEGIGFDHPECAHTGPSDHSSHSSGFRVGIDGAAAYGAIDSFGNGIVDYDPNHSYSVAFIAPSSGKLAVGDDYAFGACAPGSGCVNSTTGSYTVKIFGPAATSTPPDTTPPASTPTACTAAVALISRKCTDLPLQFGPPMVYDAPDFGNPVVISSDDLPPETKKVLLEVGIDDPEIQRIVVTALVRQRAKHLNDQLDGCVVMGLLFRDYSQQVTGARVNDVGGGKLGALLHACTKFLVQEYEAGRGRSAHIAADGCGIYFVPLFPKGKPIDKRRRTRELKRASSILRGSCTATNNTFSVSLQSHGKGNTLNQFFSGRPRTAVTGIAPKGKTVSPGSHLAVRWSLP
jgi:hypothetical protein